MTVEVKKEDIKNSEGENKIIETSDLNGKPDENKRISNRKKSRKLLFQKLYAKSFTDFDDESFKEAFFDNVFTFIEDKEYVNEMIKIITFYEPFFINTIKQYSPKFNVKSMSLSYVLPIYIGMAEMFFLTEEIPGKVSINESVEVAKVYGDDSAKRIVNGIMNKVYLNVVEIDKTKEDNFDNITDRLF